MTNAAIRRLNDVLPQAVAALVAAKKPPIDLQIIWLTPPETTAGPEEQAPTASVVDVLDQMRRQPGATARPDLVALAGSIAQRPSGNNILVGPDQVARQLASRALIRPLDDFLRTTSLVKLDDYFPGALAASRINGKLYGLPLSIVPTMLLYDRQLFEAAGVTIPAGGWDWQQLLEASLKLTKPPQQYAFAPTSLNVGMFVLQNGGAILSEDGRRCLLDQPAAIEGAAFYASLFRPRTIVAPQGDGPISFNGGVLTYSNTNIAMLPNFGSISAPVAPDAPRRLYLAEPFHGKVQNAGLGMQDILVMTSGAADPSSDFEAMAALAKEMQQRLFVPATLSAAGTAEPSQQGLQIGADEQAAILRTALYATYGRFAGGPDVAAALRSLDTALQGGADAAASCRGATQKINAILGRPAGT